MRVQLIPIAADDQSVLDNLYQFYQYDFSEIIGFPVTSHGSFRRDEAEIRAMQPGYYSFFIRADAELAGFVIVAQTEPLRGGPGSGHEIDQFFVLRGMRRKGVGAQAAILAFEWFPGRWIVKQMAENTVALAFWRAVIGRYTDGQYEDLPCPDAAYHGGTMQIFDNTH